MAHASKPEYKLMELGISGPGKKPNPLPVEAVTIPNTCTCIWCGGTMEQRGPTFLGSGMNFFSMWCTRCNAIAIHMDPGSRKVKSIDHTVHYEDEERK